MNWLFTKMHGAGNDFVVLDGVRQNIQLTPERARKLAHRQFGVGADQILLVEPATRADADFRYRIFNADGGEVEHCGNGARCFVRFLHEQGLTDRNPIRAEICTGIIVLNEQDDGEVSVEMGRTSFEPQAVPFDDAGLVARREGEDRLWPLDVSAEEGVERIVWVSVVGISNPHAVQLVDDVDSAPVGLIGPRIENHRRFPRRVNAGFMQVVDRNNIRLRVYERGSGETLACGTGACAAVAAGVRRGLLDSPVRVQTRGGVLTIAWDGEQLLMTGPAVTVFKGSVDVDRLLG
jgi:diaminopimelate epimerase